MQEIEVKVENDHIERLTTAKPILALSELIWNAYDADASTVRVEFEEGGLTKLALIRVQDDGDGIPYEDAEGYFKSLGAHGRKRARRPKMAASFTARKAKAVSKHSRSARLSPGFPVQKVSGFLLPGRYQISRRSKSPMFLRQHRRAALSR